MYTHILIPTDGSERSARAIEQGVAIAQAMGARVSGLFVAPAPTPVVFEGLLPVGYMQPEQHAALSARAAKRHLDVIRRAARRAGVAFEAITVTGEYPAEAILHAATERHCDLIVMASHGRRGLAGVVLGCETQKVLTHTGIPVLVCR